MSSKFVLLGEALIDRTYGQNVPEKRTPGGGSLNVAVGTARLGFNTTYVTQLGSDVDGKIIQEYLAQNNVRLIAAIDNSTATSIAHAKIQQDGSAKYDFEVNFEIGAVISEASDAISNAQAIHAGSIGSYLLPGSEQVFDLFSKATAKTLTSYDPNCRPSINGDRKQVLEIVERFIQKSIMVKASDEDISWLYPDKTIEEVQDLWISLGALLVTITLGPNGVQSKRSSGAVFKLPGRKVEVIDTVGAGDSFSAAMLSALDSNLEAEKEARDWITEISDSKIQSHLRRAIVMSADTCTRSGANPPDLNRAEELGVAIF